MKKYKAGDIYAIQLKDLHYCYAQICISGDMVFFGLKRKNHPTLEEITASPIAFRVSVALDAAKLGKWKLIGNTELVQESAKVGVYKLRPVGSEKIYLYRKSIVVPIENLEELDETQAKNLEVVATWFSMHVEERLEDYFEGKPYRHAVSLNAPR
jgi:hypothetical protein